MFHDFMVLGGAGLVGTQVCRQIANSISPRRIVVASLFEHEARSACDRLRTEFGERIGFVPAWGNLFVPTDLAEMSRQEVLNSRGLRQQLLQFLYGEFEDAYQANHLVNMIRRHRPDVVVDCVNTATGLFGLEKLIISMLVFGGYCSDRTISNHCSGLDFLNYGRVGSSR